MPKINIYNIKGEIIGKKELSDKVFGVKAKEALIHQVLVSQMSNKRQVLAHTKDRSEVRGGGKKPWKQKGTGRARQGSIRAPQWIGGGIVFGPTKERNFKKKINLKMKKQAVCMVLSDKIFNNTFKLLDKIEIPEVKTRYFNEILKAIFGDYQKEKKNILFLNLFDEKLKKAGRNLTGVKILNINNINIIDLLKYQNIISTVEAVKKLEEQYK